MGSGCVSAPWGALVGSALEGLSLVRPWFDCWSLDGLSVSLVWRSVEGEDGSRAPLSPASWELGALEGELGWEGEPGAVGKTVWSNPFTAEHSPT